MVIDIQHGTNNQDKIINSKLNKLNSLGTERKCDIMLHFPCSICCFGFTINNLR